MRTVTGVVALFLALVSVPAAFGGQATVTTTDIARLQTTADEIRRDIDALRNTDATLVADTSRTLADLNDEVAALRVRLRRDGSVARDEYAGVRDRLETLRLRVQGTRPAGPATSTTSPAPGPALAGRLPVGTELEVRLQAALNSGTAKVEQRFEATTVADYTDAGRVLVPAGSVVRGFVSSVRAAGNIDRRGSLTLSFDEIRIDARSYRLRASVIQAIDGRAGEDVARIGAGAVVGAIVGGLIGGGKGALVGVLVGTGGTIAATEGSDADLPSGTILRIRLDQALDLAGPLSSGPDR